MQYANMAVIYNLATHTPQNTTTGYYFHLKPVGFDKINVQKKKEQNFQWIKNRVYLMP